MPNLADAVSSMSLEAFFQKDFFEEVLSRKGVTRESEKRQISRTRLTTSGNLTRVANVLTGQFSDHDEPPKVSDLLMMSDRELTSIPNLGKKGVRFIDAYLELFGLRRTTITAVERLEQSLTPEQKTVLRLLG